MTYDGGDMMLTNGFIHEEDRKSAGSQQQVAFPYQSSLQSAEMLPLRDQQIRMDLGLPLDAEVKMHVDIGRFTAEPQGRRASKAKPQFTLHGKQVYVNSDCVRLLPKVDYVQILLDSEHKQLALRPCKEWVCGCLEWGHMKGERRYPTHRSAELLVWKVCHLLGCKTGFRYQFNGQLARALDEYLLVFTLDDRKVFKGLERILDGREMIRRSSGQDGEDGGDPEKTGIRTYKGYVYISEDGEEAEQPEGFPVG